MARVRGSYIAKVIIVLDYEEDDFEFQPFEELDKALTGTKFNTAVENVLKDEFEVENAITVTVQKQIASIHRR